MRYLIDGNNLMHALGMVRQGMNSRNWESAQRNLLDWLVARVLTFGEVCVVFDFENRFSEKGDYQGVDILAPTRPKTADDVIKQLVKETLHPHALIVISNDVDVRTSGKKKGVRGLRSFEFIDWVDNLPKKAAQEAQAKSTKTRSQVLSEEEDKEFWLKKFEG